MKSPFSGMDPYLEPHWLDVHHRLVTYCSDWLNGQLPDDLRAATEERVAIDAEEDVPRMTGPDVRVIDPSETAHRGGEDPAEVGAGDGSIAIEAPFKLMVDLDPVMEAFVRVEDASGRLIAVIEFVSPTNKRGRGLKLYRRKRREMLTSGVHVVEIDLVRAGSWRALARPARIPSAAISPYRAIVRTGGRLLGGYVFPIRFDEPAAPVQVPLRKGDPEIRLPLQEFIDQVYERGRYHKQLDYRAGLKPELHGEELTVVHNVLEAKRPK